MSTRAGIIVTDGRSESHFYRHSDGYPSGTLPTLNLFMQWVKDGKIRSNTSQAAGWLIVIGALEYNAVPNVVVEDCAHPFDKTRTMKQTDIETIEAPQDWKCGAYEPTGNVKNHGDLAYIYTVNLATQEISHRPI